MNLKPGIVIGKLWRFWFGPTSKYKVGDAVQQVDGMDVMIVKDIYSFRDMEVPLISCIWTDPKTQLFHTRIFPEYNLRLSENATFADRSIPTVPV